MIGIDEVGRGCWAGPLLIVAARQTRTLPVGLADSKTLSRTSREKLYYDISLSCDIGEGWVLPSEIDHVGLSGAMQLGVARALTALSAATDEAIIMDGNINFCGPEFLHVKTAIKADASYPIVSAASIYAKVTRDRYMSSLGADYASYQFDKHVGYGTKLHRELLELYGVSDLHRKSYKPVQMLMQRTVPGS